MKLNLGCGKKPLDGWINVDALPGEGVDLVADVRALPYEPGLIDEIFTKHLVEHFSRTEWPDILAHWTSLLRTGGTLTIECPDWIRVCQLAASNFAGLRYQWWHVAMFGDDTKGMRHQQGFDIPRLTHELVAYGFAITRARSWHDDSGGSSGLPEYNIRVEAVKL